MRYILQAKMNGDTVKFSTACSCRIIRNVNCEIILINDSQHRSVDQSRSRNLVGKIASR